MRNWDYRYCWLRDSVLALEALLDAGYTDEALAFRDFLLRVGTGDPTNDPDHVRDRRRAAPDRVRAAGAARLRGLQAGAGRQRGVRAVPARRLRRGRGGHVRRRRAASAASSRGCGRAGARSIEHVETIWREPDDGIWESRGRAPPLHVLEGDGVGRVRPRGAYRRALRARRRRWSAGRRSATRSTRRSASAATTASAARSRSTTARRSWTPSVLNIPLVGFLAGDDERVAGTIDAIARELGRDGFVLALLDSETDDGLPGDEGQFLACSFWLVSALALNGRVEDARALFERLLGLTQRSRPARRGVRRASAGGRSATSRRRSATSR